MVLFDDTGWVMDPTRPDMRAAAQTTIDTQADDGRILKNVTSKGKSNDEGRSPPFPRISKS
jgi:hypothetical protein